MAIDLDELKNEIEHVIGTLECEFENVLDNEGEEDCLNRLDEVIQQIALIRDDLRGHSK